MTQANLNPSAIFATTIYSTKKPEFLVDVTAVADKLLVDAKAARPMNGIYPFVMSDSMLGNERASALERFISECAWVILDNQGYRMSDFTTYVSELWVQEHFKYSGMEQHVHPFGDVISGFYFLEVPQGGSLVEVHDPRPGKVQASLPFKSQTEVNLSSNALQITPEPGLMVLTNSWLPHSLTRNSSDSPIKFIHFNVATKPTERKSGPIIV